MLFLQHVVFKMLDRQRVWLLLLLLSFILSIVFVLYTSRAAGRSKSCTACAGI